MKEKIKDIIKHRYFRIVISALLWLFILNESYNIYIDMYNFGQLEKAKPILEMMKSDEKTFELLNEFNQKYHAWISPIKNCYYVGNYNWDLPYIFWFKLESIFYKIKYHNYYYAYPKYDLPHETICYNNRCNDANFSSFYWKISKPCREN